MRKTRQAGRVRARANRPRLSRTILPLAMIWSLLLPVAAASAALPTSECDFDGDNRSDLAVGAPGESIGGVDGAGAVNVIYGAGGGLAATGNQIWSQRSAGIAFDPETGDAFGSSIACGDFNKDGYDDMAVGVPHESIGSRNPILRAGAVNVIYGSRGGLTEVGDQIWHQNSSNIEGVAEAGDLLGWAVVAADFDGDGYDDLAAGAPGESVGSDRQAGSVNVIYGSASGLDAAGDQIWHQDISGIAGSAEPGDRLGESLTAGDFDNDRYDDLAIGVPGENLSIGGTNLTDAGMVNVIYGTNAGLSSVGDQDWHQASPGVNGAAEAYDLFAHSLASGDFDNDGYDDLAAGVPRESIGDVGRAGTVNVLYGSASGITATGDQTWHQDTAGIKGKAEAGDNWGLAVAVGDFDNDNRDDLAIGVPGEDIGSIVDAGMVAVLFGANSGLSSRDQTVHQDKSGIKYDSESGDGFGTTVSTGDFDGDGSSDVAIGVPGESIGVKNPIVSAGIAAVVYGGPSKLTKRDQVWHQNRSGILGLAEAYDRLGGELTSAGEYRIGYANGTKVRVSRDHLHHTPVTRIDMSGNGGGPYTLAAAADGWIRAIVDTNSEPTSSNNYVWIEHPNGEWSKYSHMVKDSVTDLGLSVGQWVSAGTAIGIESDVGQASGDHLHFQVSRPNDPANPISAGGFIIGEDLIPIICGIPGNMYVSGETYTAGDC